MRKNPTFALQAILQLAALCFLAACTNMASAGRPTPPTASTTAIAPPTLEYAEPLVTLASVAVNDFSQPAARSNWAEIGPTADGDVSTWQIVGGRLERTPAAVATALVTGDAKRADYDISVTAYTPGEASFGLVFRAGARGYYLFRILPGMNPAQVLARFDNDTLAFTDLAAASNTLSAGEWHAIRVRVDGDRIQAFVDDQPVLEAHDSTFERGRVGVFGDATATLLFDNFTVRALLPSDSPLTNELTRTTPRMTPR